MYLQDSCVPVVPDVPVVLTAPFTSKTELAEHPASAFSTAASATASTPPEVPQDWDAPLEIYNPRDPQAKELFRLGYTYKAFRFEELCGKMRVHTCPVHGIRVVENMHCGLRFCPRCAPLLAEAAFQRYRPDLRIIQGFHGQDAQDMQLLELEVDLPATGFSWEDPAQDRAIVQQMLNDFRPQILLHLTAANIQYSTTWTNLPCIDVTNKTVKLRAMVVVTGHRQNSLAHQWNPAWPEGKVRVTLQPRYRIEKSFQWLVTPAIATNAQHRAYNEAVLTGMRTFRSHLRPEVVPCVDCPTCQAAGQTAADQAEGQTAGQADANLEKLSVVDTPQDTTDNSEVRLPAPPKGRHNCQLCGHLCTVTHEDPKAALEKMRLQAANAAREAVEAHPLVT